MTAVLCDGIACDGFIYKYLYSELSSWLCVAHWNYRGHGRSENPRDSNRIDVADHAEDLDCVRRHLGDPSVVLVGHSFGTQVVLEALRRRASGVVAMVLLCGTFGRITHTFRGTDVLANLLPNLIRFATKHPKLARAVWSRMPAATAVRVARITGEVNAQAIRPQDMEPYFQHVAHVDFKMFLRMLALAGEHSAEDLLPTVQVPTLVVAGDRDSFTPAAISKAMAEAIPTAELWMIPGGTHVAPLEHHAEVALRIHELLLKHGIVGRC